MDISKSEKMYQQAEQYIPGGVNSPARACSSVGGKPIFIESAQGARMVDVNGNSYIDYVLSWGPLILGHRHPSVIRLVEEALKQGTSFGAPTEHETVLARMVTEMVPSVEKLRFVNSGTEATMSAVRLARAYTGRDIIIKFDGCYHGHADTLLVAAGSGVATLDIPGTPGVPKDIITNTLSLKYNDIEEFKSVMAEKGDRVAGIIVEPVAGNMGMIMPGEGFLEELREQSSKYGSLLIFDEVMTGFRVSPGCAQGLFGIRPDLTCFGKVIGGGLPVGAYGGKKEIMDRIAPKGDVYQAGTLSGNPLAMAAGIATLQELRKEGIFDTLNAGTARLINGIKKAAEDAGISVSVSMAGAMAGVFFSSGEVNSFEDAKKCDLDMFAKYYNGMLKKGIYLAPSQFEAIFTSTAHTSEDIDLTIEAASEVLSGISR